MSQMLVQMSQHVPLLQGLDVVSSIEHACGVQAGLAQRDCYRNDPTTSAPELALLHPAGGC
jgi:hypothetical protein